MREPSQLKYQFSRTQLIQNSSFKISAYQTNIINFMSKKSMTSIEFIELKGPCSRCWSKNFGVYLSNCGRANGASASSPFWSGVAWCRILSVCAWKRRKSFSVCRLISFQVYFRLFVVRLRVLDVPSITVDRVLSMDFARRWRPIWYLVHILEIWSVGRSGSTVPLGKDTKEKKTC